MLLVFSVSLSDSPDELPAISFYSKVPSGRHSLDRLPSASTHKDKNRKNKKRRQTIAITMRDLPTPSKGTPVKTPAKATPVKTPAKVTPVKTPTKTTPAKTPVKITPVKTPTKTPAKTTPVKHSSTKRNISTPRVPSAKRARMMSTPSASLGNAVALRAIHGKTATPKLTLSSKKQTPKQIQSAKKKTPGPKSWADVARRGIATKGGRIGKTSGKTFTSLKTKTTKAKPAKLMPVSIFQGSSLAIEYFSWMSYIRLITGNNFFVLNCTYFSENTSSCEESIWRS